MPATTLVREFILLVQETLQDKSPVFTRWPEAGLVRWINLGTLALAKYLPAVSSRTSVVRLADGTKQDFSRVLGTHIIGGVQTDGLALLRLVRNMGANGATVGRAIRGPVDRYSKDALEPDWHNETGTAVLEFVFDKSLPTVCWVSPAPAPATQVWVELEWMAVPTRLTAGAEAGPTYRYVTGGAGESDVVPVPDQYIEELHHYVVAMALFKGSKDTQNIPKAQQFAGMFVQALNAQAEVQTGVNPNLTALPFLNEG